LSKSSHLGPSPSRQGTDFINYDSYLFNYTRGAPAP
jgi:hypothetical protein